MLESKTCLYFKQLQKDSVISFIISFYDFKLDQEIGPLWDFCAPISIIVGLVPVIPYPQRNNW